MTAISLSSQKYRKIVYVLLCVSMIFAIVCCKIPSTLSKDEQLTETAVRIKQTEVSLKQTTVAAPTNTPTLTWTPTLSDTITPTFTITKTPTHLPDSPSDIQPAGFEEWKSKANILLFEDMVADPTKSRYVKDTLDKLGMSFVDVGNATGRFREKLIIGTDTGDQWDLVIVAIEARGEVSGELFEYIYKVMDDGTSVIIEEWMLDRIFNGKIKPMLQKCGIGIKDYYGAPGIRLHYMLEPVDSNDSILNEPNKNLDFKNVNLFWRRDLGSLVSLTGTGDAKILLKLISTDKSPYGVLTVCMENRLILQTFSSHNFPEDMMMKVWENYIHNALKTRYIFLHGDGT